MENKGSLTARLLRHTVVYYILVGMLMLHLVDFELWHRLRLFNLMSIVLAAEQKNPYDNILFYDYFLQIMPGDKRILLELGDNYWMIGDQRRACKAYSQALKGDSQEIARFGIVCQGLNTK